MADTHRIPPGRTGRLWLRRRIHIAERGIDLLDRKLWILRGEQQRFHVLEKAARERWEQAAQRARRWLLRAVMLGGQRELRLASPDAPAAVDITWSEVMGVRYPSAATCILPEAEATDREPGNAAMHQAVLAHREALRAAAQFAVAAQARRTIDAEVSEVRRRRTAIANRWLPRLTTALREMEHGLEEMERAESSRLRRFAAQQSRGAERQ